MFESLKIIITRLFIFNCLAFCANLFAQKINVDFWKSYGLIKLSAEN